MALADVGTRLRSHQDVVLAGYEAMVDLARFGHGRVAPFQARPYAIDHVSGAFVDVPELLVTRQRVNTADQAEAYVERLGALSDAIHDERRRLGGDARAGIVPPPAVLARIQRRAASLGAGTAEDHPLTVTFENLLTGAIDIDDVTRRDLVGRARRIISRQVLPAYRDLSEDAYALLFDASDIPGVWRLPNGDAYYAKLLALYTRADADPERLHSEGRDLVGKLSDRLDRELFEAGLAEGPVGERLAALALREDQLFEDTPEGRAALVSAMEAWVQAARRHTGPLIGGADAPAMIVTTLPEPLETLSPAVVYRPPSVDGAYPATLSLNMSRRPGLARYSLASLACHEGVPGHHTQATQAMALERMPLIRQVMWPAGYGEGWATYGEDLCAEAGLFETDRLARIGYLQSKLLRAARLVVDTGLHRMRWTRGEAIDYLVTTTGLARSEMAIEVDRYTAWPGQAASDMFGRQQIRTFRARAKAELGMRFDLRAFHREVLSGGPRPLSQVEDDIVRWSGGPPAGAGGSISSGQ